MPGGHHVFESVAAAVAGVIGRKQYLIEQKLFSKPPARLPRERILDAYQHAARFQIVLRTCAVLVCTVARSLSDLACCVSSDQSTWMLPQRLL
jgi:hypothetical protein